jgi:hypothetical protein
VRPILRALALGVCVAAAGASCAPRADREDLTPPPGFVAPPVRELQANPAGAGRLGFGAGFFPMEVGGDGRTWRWMGGRGELRLRNDGRRHRLRLAGWVPLEILGGAPTVRLGIEGHPLDTFTQRDPPFAKEYVVTPELLGRAPAAVLVIETDRTGQAPGDPRTLGVSIEKITWERY